MEYVRHVNNVRIKISRFRYASLIFKVVSFAVPVSVAAALLTWFLCTFNALIEGETASTDRVVFASIIVAAIGMHFWVQYQAGSQTPAAIVRDGTTYNNEVSADSAARYDSCFANKAMNVRYFECADALYNAGVSYRYSIKELFVVTFSSADFRGVIAHELSHCFHKDPMYFRIRPALALASAAIGALLAIQVLPEFLIAKDYLFWSGISFLYACICIMLLERWSSRECEYLCDIDAQRYGADDIDMVSSLTALDRITMQAKIAARDSSSVASNVSESSKLERLIHTHPPMDNRLALLELLKSRPNQAST